MCPIEGWQGERLGLLKCVHSTALHLERVTRLSGRELSCAVVSETVNHPLQLQRVCTCFVDPDITVWIWGVFSKGNAITGGTDGIAQS